MLKISKIISNIQKFLYDDVEFSKFFIDRKFCDSCTFLDVFWYWLSFCDRIFDFREFRLIFWQIFFRLQMNYWSWIFFAFSIIVIKFEKRKYRCFQWSKRAIEIVFIDKISESNNWRRVFEQFVHLRFVRFDYRFQRIRNRNQSIDSRKIRIDRWFTTCCDRLKQIQCELIKNCQKPCLARKITNNKTRIFDLESKYLHENRMSKVEMCVKFSLVSIWTFADKINFQSRFQTCS